MATIKGKVEAAVRAYDKVSSSYKSLGELYEAQDNLYEVLASMLNGTNRRYKYIITLVEHFNGFLPGDLSEKMNVRHYSDYKKHLQQKKEKKK